MIRRILISFFTFFILFQVKAQISEGGLPPSFSYETNLRSEIAVTDISVPFNVEDLILVDEWQVSNGAPLKVATSIPVDLTLTNSGNWQVLPGGEKIWQLRIQAKEAIALMLYYKTFRIPEGGKLFIYNADKTQVLGAYTHRTNPRGDRFATEFIAGDDLILEYVPAPSGEVADIEIEEIGYGYNHLQVFDSNELRSSGSCMVNINCSEGAAWQKEKAGVCYTIQKIGSNSYICSGSLVNNTAQDFKPYVLMAYHCMEETQSDDVSVVSTPEDMKQWMFYFNRERQGCSDSSPAIQRTMTGCKKVAATNIDGGSDGLLLLLDQDVPESYNVYYNGWDRRNIAAQSGVGIHHPEGDYKKISTYTSQAKATTWNGTNSTVGAKNAHWNVIFSETENGHGVTEGGSSGSPLFNENHLIVGTLSGGTSSCEKPTGVNLYGKLSYHWNKFTQDDSTRMDVWLDPDNTGAETLSGLSHTVSKPSPTYLQISYMNKTVNLSWQAPVSTETPTLYSIYRTNQLIGTTQNTNYSDMNVDVVGEVIYSVTAEYADESESLPLMGSIVIQEYKAPSDLTLSTEAGGVVLNWDAPIYKQAISWSTGDPNSVLGVDIPIYFGHLWEADDLKGIANNTITAVEFYAAKEATYSLALIQGNNRYTQAVVSPATSGILSVELTTPFVIDATKELIVALYTYSSNDEVGTMGIDEGPAVIGKGNLISEDAVKWFVLYDGTEDSENQFDNNFYLAAIVSSEQGTTTRMGAAAAEAENTKKAYPVSVIKTDIPNLSLRAISATRSTQLQYPAAFPEITGYNVYRNSILLNSEPVKGLEYTDKAAKGVYSYGVSTVYSGEESEQVLLSSISVSNAQIPENGVYLSPAVFKEQIRILNADKVTQLEIYSISGQLITRIVSPEETINTSALIPGAYIFKLYTKDGIKSVQTIKK
ncbi:T9SS type A sorting domain-containing protein [Massilibacteroides sp.]|uniref:T9SS type A sorting domain-containing protein n=1 Tax=Massilibacteroides sp. TaxID=2034766 RepID=UPI0026134D9D|nr:T9SS type A sorting domain-containing protein [Massilibacteroides sp.]MDD4514231.1 T9SS type A sorting domain-containing protein [Massilibacteroides sp.]